MKRRVLFVSRGRYLLPLASTLERKWDALGAALDVHVLASAGDRTRADERFTLLPPVRPAMLDGALFWCLLPFRVARVLRRFRPDAIVAQSPYEGLAALAGRRLARLRPAVLIEVHGDWRTFTRLYGSPSRAVLAGPADRLARLALRRAEGVRTIGPYTTGLVRAEGVAPVAEFPAYMDLGAFMDRPVTPLPEAPRALFVGVLERYKAVDVLFDAWRLAAAERPDAVLHVAGRGTLSPLAERLVADLPGQVEWTPILSVAEVAAALDASTILVLPSRSEGMGRVLVEAACRGRGVVASRVGGILDVAADGESAVLVPAGDTAALARVLVRVLSERALAERLGAAARATAERWLVTPDEYASRVAEVVEKLAR